MRGLAPQKSQLWSMRMLDPEGAAVMGDALAETGKGLVVSQYGGAKRSFLPWKKRRAVSGAGARSEHGFEGGCEPKEGEHR